MFRETILRYLNLMKVLTARLWRQFLITVCVYVAPRPALKFKKDMHTSLCTIRHCSVPAGNEIAGPSFFGQFGTLWPVLRAKSEPRTAVTSPWRCPRALHRSGTLGQTWWSSGSPWQHWTSPPLQQLSRSLGPVWSERDKLVFTIIGVLFSF